MQPALDEFSLNDLRHTLVEAWRIICHRRWFFVFPFLSCSSVALILSLWLPREFTATTVIRREHDPILASLMGKTWTEPYAEIRQRMSQDLSDLGIITSVLDELSLPRPEDVAAGREFLQRKPRSRRELADRVARGITTRAVESSPNRDIIEVSLTLSDSAHVGEILSRLRDRYVENAKKRTQEVLVHVQEYYQTEATRCRSELAGLNRTVKDLERKFPGVNPEIPDPMSVEEADLLTERRDIGRRLDDLRRQKVQTDFAISRRESGVTDPATVEVAQTPNPRRAELANDIDRLEREIMDAKTQRFMTDQHPSIQRLRAAISVRQAEHDQLPLTISGSVKSDAGSAHASSLETLRREQAGHDDRIAVEEHRLSVVQDRLTQIDRARQAALLQRETYGQDREKLARLTQELAGWEQNIAPVRQLVKLEGNNRGIHFATVREAQMLPRPTFPRCGLVIGFCLAIGAAAGGLVMALSEILDHSFRTIRALSGAISVPVIECVDEIMSCVERRRRRVRKLVIAPSLALILVLLTVFAGTLAYRSLESPANLVAWHEESSEAPTIALSDEE